MDETKRRFIKVLPLAAMTAATVKVGAVEAQAYEIKPNKKYVFAVSGVGADSAEVAARFSRTLRGHGVDAVVVINADLNIYELDKE